MHLVTILAYACLFWRAAGPITPHPLIASPAAVFFVVVSQPVLLWIAARLVSRRTLRQLGGQAPAMGPLQFYHRANVGLRAALLVGFAIVALATPWPEWFRRAYVAPELQVLIDLVVLALFFSGAIAIWVGTFNVESALRHVGAGLFRANAPLAAACGHDGRNEASPARFAAKELEILRCAQNDGKGTDSTRDMAAIDLEILRRAQNDAERPGSATPIPAPRRADEVPATARAIGLPAWRMRNYLDFNIRHQLLVVAVPMTLVLFAANLTGGYERQLREWTGSIWAPDVALAGAAAAVFVASPVFLRRIWKTEPLPPGETRLGLEALCRRIRLRVRDILVWKSDGLMINAAVMGVIPPLRYVLLSDTLLATMSPGQVEAVFGHEAGHVRHRHILHFLVFALVGWIATATTMEAAAQMAVWAKADPDLWVPIVQGIGVTATLLFWGIGFGWLSRRFERQADAFAARCAAPSTGSCGVPCSVHLDADTVPIVSSALAIGLQQPLPNGRGSETQPLLRTRRLVPSRVTGADARVCAGGATMFASALDQVALLNAIPRNEPSWRHSSIASRIRFLMSLAEDPARAFRFERMIRRVKAGMVIAAVIGAAAWVAYWLSWGDPAIVQAQAAGP